MIASSLDGDHRCHNIQVSGADACAQQYRMPLRNPVSRGQLVSVINGACQVFRGVNELFLT